MFSFLKKSATPEENVLQELSEEQLLQVAGGSDCYKSSYSNDHDADDMKKKHHHHHHHNHKNEHKVWDDDHDSYTWAPNTSSNGYSSGKW